MKKLLIIVTILLLMAFAAPGLAMIYVTGTSGGGATMPSTSNLIKGDNAGGAAAATPGVDYCPPPTTITYSATSTNVTAAQLICGPWLTNGTNVTTAIAVVEAASSAEGSTFIFKVSSNLTTGTFTFTSHAADIYLDAASAVQNLTYPAATAGGSKLSCMREKINGTLRWTCYTITGVPATGS